MLWMSSWTHFMPEYYEFVQCINSCFMAKCYERVQKLTFYAWMLSIGAQTLVWWLTCEWMHELFFLCQNIVNECMHSRFMPEWVHKLIKRVFIPDLWEWVPEWVFYTWMLCMSAWTCVLLMVPKSVWTGILCLNVVNECMDLCFMPDNMWIGAWTHNII